jgi:hypothetical protein
MSARIQFDGLAELRAALRSLPQDLAGEARHIVEGAANSAAADIGRAYARGRTGDLIKGVTVAHVEAGKYSAGAVVKNTSKLANIVEVGTVARHYFSKHGVKHLTGRRPAAHVFVPRVIRARRKMYDELKDMLVRNGLTVTGDER